MCAERALICQDFVQPPARHPDNPMSYHDTSIHQVKPKALT